MKFKRFLLLWLFVLPFLHGCGFDENIETHQQKDGDDLNVIQNIWPQALDQALSNTATHTNNQ